MAPFKVIIVGGSIAGLTLANIFERYGIDFIVLEKHEKIAPALGAGFAIWPHGARVLDQLGCFDALEQVNAPLNHLMVFNEDGTFRGPPPGFGEWMETLLGYRLRFMERRHVIQTLFDNLPCKSKVHTSRGVVKVESHSDGVAVETSDGSVFHGDIVIGADGVHSRVRREMQRCAEKEVPGLNLFPEEHAFESTWSALFGISNTTLGLEQDLGFKSTHKGRSYLTARGPDDTMYWILFFKNEKKTRGSGIPRYTDEDLNRLVAMYENDALNSGHTFGELYKARIQTSLVPLEEGVLKTCFYRRVVLVGDSWHKIHPISGLGGNHGILSAAFLADELKSLVERQESPDEDALQKIFLLYQQKRGPAVDKIVALSSKMQRLDALDSFPIRLVQKHLAPRFSIATIQGSLINMLNPAVRLKHLPLPSRRGRLGFIDEVKIEPKRRSSLVNWTWIVLLALVAMVFYPIRNPSNVTESTEWDTSISSGLGLDAWTGMQLQFNLSLSVVLSIAAVESYRSCFFMQFLSSTLPFSIASYFIGWELLTVAYFSIFILSTAAKQSYFPSARSLDLAMVKALPVAFLVTYVAPTVYTLNAVETSAQAWAIAHASLPVVLSICRRVASRVSAKIDGPELFYGKKDVLPLVTFFLGTAILQGGISRLIHPNGLAHTISWSGHAMGPTQAKAAILDIVILVFSLFSYWDLRRVNAITSAYYPELILGVVIALEVSPATTLGLLWAIRESQWEEARAKKNRDVI
ncbi:hypothetical protein N7492_008146 [Penicillium capsulatum]|uniref:FAD-binding domain-containing protein n=1 Tax=Penicillium capsulatum TaxID=69766 RepID=A0A9W9HRK2_9EURO|nr:hypothetical protein N7492_008146 [Penicillium capsulatum]KAJ6105557.1 hypothetical protein N7512_009074 [Penicillium capsulatum]